MALSGSLELRIWSPGSEVSFAAGRDALQGSPPVSGPQLPPLGTQGLDWMASQVLAGLSSSGCSTWTDFLSQGPFAHAWWLLARLLQPPETRGAFSLWGFVMDGQNPPQPSPGALGVPWGHAHLSSDPRGFLNLLH